MKQKGLPSLPWLSVQIGSPGGQGCTDTLSSCSLLKESGTSLSQHEEPIIKDIVDDISEDGENYDFDLDDEDQFNRSSSQYIPSSSQSERNINRDLNEHMSFMSKEAKLNAIKQYHIDNGYKFVVVESKLDKYVARCIHHDGGCQWRLHASFSKIRSQWEIKKIDAQHSCLSTNLSADHVNLDSTHIASMVLTSVKANPSVPIKSLIAEIKNLYGYTITYRKAWLGKQKALALAFGNWEQSYNDLPRWLEAVKKSNTGTIVQYISSPCMIDGVQGNSCYTLDRVFWSFKPCINGFNFCKPIVQVDETFLIERYHGTLLTEIAQDANQNIFPLAFAIVEGETREALIWFFQLLRQYVTPQPNLSMISDRGTAYDMKRPTVQAKLSVMRYEFKQAFSWIDRIPLEKWTQAYDGGKRYGHMTTNLAKWINFMLKGARSLPISALVKTFIDLVYNLHTIKKAFPVEFHPVRNEDYWSTYIGPNFIPDPHM
ncbi:uncharacterized protein [Phaseolus vulgaris]|uniref:uncharacterized protein n=1 Tax=Phaseolus vulgaris TaxID=3885 RepID=UPI0035CA5DF2